MKRFEKFDFDLDPVKRDLKYYIDLYIFNKLAHFTNYQQLDNNKKKFQITLIVNKEKPFNKVYK